MATEAPRGGQWIEGRSRSSLPDVLLALFLQRDAPKEYRGWMVGCLHTGVCFPDLRCTLELPLWLNSRGERGHRPFRCRSFAAFTVNAELCLAEAGSDMSVGVGGNFSAGQSPVQHTEPAQGWLSPPSLGSVGTLAAAPQARLSMVGRAASAFQRSLLEGDNEADGVSASPSPGLCARGPGSKEMSRGATRTLPKLVQSLPGQMC